MGKISNLVLKKKLIVDELKKIRTKITNYYSKC